MPDSAYGFMVGTVVQRTSDQADFRILWLDPQKSSFWIQLNCNSNIPLPFFPEQLEAQLSEGSFIYVLDTYVSHIGDKEIKESDARRRDRAWHLIEKAALAEPEIYDTDKRGIILKELCLENGGFAQNLYPYLGRYWKGGKVPNALLPDFSRCGKSRDPYKEGTKPPGRRRKDGSIGKKLSHEDLRIFQSAIDKYYSNASKPSLKEAYGAMIRNMYRKKDENGNPVDCEAGEIPTYRQFHYWHSTNKDVIKEEKKRKGEGSFDLNSRGITGKTETSLFGPGEKVQIDATIGDLYLVRRDDRSKIAGRPSIYFVKDAKTRMVTGMYVSLDPPSWHSAGLALINMGEDKVEFCKRYGIEITQEQWPCQNLPCVLLADRGEVESRFADKLVNELGITVENTPPYRGDLKGIIERFFRLVDVSLGSDIKGRVMSDMGERGTRDYRLDAQLDIIQFTQILIHIVLFYNNKHYLTSYTRTFLMRQRGTRPIPLELWDFGIHYETGALRIVSRERIRYALLPQGEGKITRYGITFQGLTYSCRQAEQEQWFAQARIQGSETITVSYDPRDAAFIYLRLPGREAPVECHLLKHHEMYVGMQTAEASVILEADKAEAKRYEITELNARMSLDDKIDQIKAEAAAMAPDTSGMTKAERIGSIQENRRMEQEAMSDENTTRSLSAAGLIPTDPKMTQPAPTSQNAASEQPRSALDQMLDEVASEVFQEGGSK